MRYECPNCETVFLHADTCPSCGWSATKTAKVTAKPEGYAPWVAPTYPPLKPGDDEKIRAEMARARELLGMPPKSQADADTENPPREVDAETAQALERVQAERQRRNADGPEPVGAVVGRVIAQGQEVGRGLRRP